VVEYRSSMPQPTLIFSLLDSPAFGGAENYVVLHLKHLYDQGNAIFLGVNNPAVMKEIRKRLAGVDESRFHLVHAPYLLDAIGNWKGLVKFFVGAPFATAWVVWVLLQLKQKYQIICLLPGWSDRLIFSPFIKWLGLSLVWIEIGPLEPLFPRNWGFPKLLYALTRWTPDHIVLTSKWTGQSMVRTCKLDAKKMTLIYPGIELRKATDIKRLQTLGKKEIKKRGLAGNTLVGFLGRLASENEVELVIEAFAKLPKRKKTKLLIIGDGPSRADYEKLVEGLGIKKDVHFTGFIDEQTKFSLLSQLDVFVFTRAWELDGFGMTTIEAMSLGVAAITSDFGPQKEIFTEGVEGLRFVPHESGDLSKKIAQLLKNKTLRQKISKKGAERVKAFDQRIMEKRMMKVLSQFLPLR
jgi:glycosyltransferase involved in cell wall biosynthesis